MHYVLFVFVVFVTNIVQGITGFAGAILAMPFCIFLTSLPVAKAVINILSRNVSIYSATSDDYLNV